MKKARSHEWAFLMVLKYKIAMKKTTQLIVFW